MPIDRAHSSPDYDEDVDEVILATVFRDGDHDEELNKVRGEQGQRIYYDFEKAFRWLGGEHILEEALQSLTDQQLSSLAVKLDQLESRLQGEEGLAFLSAAYAHAGQTKLHAYEEGDIISKKIVLTPLQLQQALLGRVITTRAKTEEEQKQRPGSVH